MFKRFVRKAFFRAKQHHVAAAACVLRSLYWRAQGMQIGRGVRFSSLDVTWPHKVRLGDRCSLEHGIYFNAAGPYTEGVSIHIGEGCFVGTGCEFNITAGITLGTNSLVAAGSRFVDHNHGTARGTPIKYQDETAAPITIGPDVWIGANCLILQGVVIGEGAVVAAGSVVTRAVAPYTVVAGCPARPVRVRREPGLLGPELVQLPPAPAWARASLETHTAARRAEEASAARV